MSEKIEKVMFNLKKGQCFTLSEFIKKSKLEKVFECENRKDKDYLRRFSQSILYLYEKKKWIQRVDTKNTKTKGRPEIIYESLGDLSIQIGEDIKLSKNG